MSSELFASDTPPILAPHKSPKNILGALSYAGYDSKCSRPQFIPTKTYRDSIIYLGAERSEDTLTITNDMIAFVSTDKDAVVMESDTRSIGQRSNSPQRRVIDKFLSV